MMMVVVVIFDLNMLELAQVVSYQAGLFIVNTPTPLIGLTPIILSTP